MAREEKGKVMAVVAAILLWAAVCAGIVGAKTVVKIAKHLVKGSGVTEAQLEAQFETIKEIWDSENITHVQVGGVDEVNNVNEGRVPGAINIYGTSLSVNSPGNPGICHDWDYIELGPNSASDTGAHEEAHWGKAKPDDTTHPDGHGDPCGSYPGDANRWGYDTDGDGDFDGNDTNNLSFPGTGRTGSEVDPNQRRRYEDTMKKWVDSQKAIKGERGKDEPDTLGDASYSFIDIRRTTVWCIGANEADYQMHFKMLLAEYPGPTDPCTLLGFYIESDQSCETGGPPEGLIQPLGLDRYVGYDANSDTAIYAKYEGGMWVHYAANQIEVKKEYMAFDGPFASIPIGVRLSVPMSMLRDSPSNLMSYVAVAEEPVGGFFDVAPDSGQSTIITEPLPTPDVLEGDVDGDWDVDLYDLSKVAANWLVGTD